MGVLNMIENNLQAAAGEVLLLTSGEFDSHGVSSGSCVQGHQPSAAGGCVA